MAKQITLPKLGLTMEEATVAEWLKSPGDEVRLGDVIALVETDKASMEIEADQAGILAKIVAQPGDAVPVGGILCALSDGPPSRTVAAAVDGTADAGNGAIAANTAREGPAVGDESDKEAVPGKGATGDAASDVAAERPNRAAESSAEVRLRASPAVRRLAAERGVDLTGLRGSGPSGRIVLRDILPPGEREDSPPTAVEAHGAVGPQPLAAPQSPVLPPPSSMPQPPAAQEAADVSPASALRPQPPAGPAKLQLPPPFPPPGEKAALTAIRLMTARRMAHSWASVPQFHIRRQVDMSAVLRLREALLRSVETSSGVRLSVNDFVIAAAARALRNHPNVNGSFVGEATEPGEPYVWRHRDVHIGLAVAADKGIVVPVVRHVDRLTLVDIAKQRQRLVGKARDGTLAVEEMAGGTFTISNLAAQEADEFAAIVNPPQAAILAVGRTTDRVVADGDRPVVRPAMTVTASFDHRVVDGVEGAMFLKELVDQLQSDDWNVI